MKGKLLIKKMLKPVSSTRMRCKHDLIVYTIHKGYKIAVLRVIGYIEERIYANLKFSNLIELTLRKQ